jgi:hypothetical protein
MARAILKQPNGLWCLFSSIVDDFIVEDASMDELKQWMYEEAVFYAKQNVDRSLEEAELGMRIGLGPSTYEQAKELRDMIHTQEEK